MNKTILVIISVFLALGIGVAAGYAIWGANQVQPPLPEPPQAAWWWEGDFLLTDTHVESITVPPNHSMPSYPIPFFEGEQLSLNSEANSWRENSLVIWRLKEVDIDPFGRPVGVRGEGTPATINVRQPSSGQYSVSLSVKVEKDGLYYIEVWNETPGQIMKADLSFVRYR